MLRFLTSGESHGPALSAILDGLPYGVPIDVDQINSELWRRQQGYGRGARQKIEKDQINIIGGVRHGITTGAPISFLLPNHDYENWKHVMSTTEVDHNSPEVAAQLQKKAIGQFRPGHADLAGTLKFGHTDIRDVLERASARETAARVAIGAICQLFLGELGIQLVSYVAQVGQINSLTPDPQLSLSELDKIVLESEMFCPDSKATEKMKELIKTTWQEGDSLGGVVEVLVDGLPIGLGSYTQWDKKLDGQLAQALMSIQAIKAVELGDGITSAGLPGSLVHDALFKHEGQAVSASDLPFYRNTNHAGGIEGGMTNGERLRVKAFMKPIPTLRKGLPSLTFPEYNSGTAHYERSDVCAISACSVVCKAMVAIVLAQAVIDKFGGDSLGDIKSALAKYRTFANQFEKKASSVGSSLPLASDCQSEDLGVASE